uniref:Ubiquitin-like protein ATG12 n=2 Tax=Plectus sambesii TaxID=2011161 RepID=A0A914UV12_9BILA
MLTLSRDRELCEMSEAPTESAAVEESPGESAAQEGEANKAAVQEGDGQSTAPEQQQQEEVARRPSVPTAAASGGKIEVLLKPVGDAPIMKQKKWSVETNKSVAWIIAFVRKYIKMNVSDSLFIYVNQCFAPSPDQSLGNLFDCFASDGKLVLHYSTTQAWG